MGESAVKLEDSSHENNDEFFEARAMLDYAPTPIMFCDRDYIIRYMNQKSFDLLKRIEKYLPVRASEIVGSTVDIFHKNPSHQHRILQDDRNLPHQATISVGPEKLNLLVTATYDKAGSYSGMMLTWDIVTEKLKQENELARIKSMMDNAPVAVMATDLDFNIVYLNPKSQELLRSLERHLPIPAHQVLGSSFDIFHKHPEHQRRMLASDKNLPHIAKIKLGPETLQLSVTAMYGVDRDYLGPMLTWEVITQRVEIVNRVGEAANHLAAAASQLNATANQMAGNANNTNQEASSVAVASEQVSRSVQTVATNTEEMVASIKEIARNAGDASNATGQAVKDAESTNVNISALGVSSQEIGNVIKVISSIAQQTNLLALNATIEAARAGEAGKGFAVVANEVKELAKQTAKATEEITQKISSIQRDSGLAVDAIGSITTSVQKIDGIATAIAAAVEEQQATTTEVSRVVQESAEGVHTISTSIKKVSDASDQTKNGASQVLEAAGSLSELAVNLQKLVDEIRI